MATLISYLITLTVVADLIGTTYTHGTHGTHTSTADPIVTLSHGGQLQGRSVLYQGQPVDLFTGIRYAQAPTGDRRFTRPSEYPAWNGVVEAKSTGNMCIQYDIVGQLAGDEDCLFLYVTVPGRVGSTGARKPVMVWIYGGGFTAGAAVGYIGAPLATTGDVIMVSINYRLGMLGFLADGQGSGNFGLWDIRAALQWVQTNIASFGGDPDEVTIFGESAGASAVSALTLSTHSDGLFKRAIQQSGTLFTHWSWYKSEGKKQRLVQQAREATNCTSSGSVYECFSGMTSEQVANTIPVLDSFNPPFGPTSDNDFFPADIDKRGNQLSRRFDLMCGVNGQEAAGELNLDAGMFASLRNQSVANGMTLDLVRQYLQHSCETRYTPLSPGLCVDYIIGLYRLDRVRSDRERMVRLSYFMSEMLYDAAAVRNLEDHSTSNKSTYAYYFTERYYPNTDVEFFNIPEWLKRSADHTQELPFLFGAAFLADETDSTWSDLINSDWFADLLLDKTLTARYKSLSRRMMTMWTNFAISGNPNTPKSISDGTNRATPVWPEFNKASSSFLEINEWYSRIRETPNKARLESLYRDLLSTRDMQYLADTASCVV